MKNILMIATGGTIASKEGDLGLTPAVTGEELAASVPGIKDICHLEILQLMNIDSTNMRPSDWMRIRDVIVEGYSDHDGFVILHGTDTMSYTAAALSYLIQDSPKPIILTGAQKPIDLDVTDARTNLLDSLRFAASERAHGVTIVFDGKVIAGTRAKKVRTKSYNAFSSINFPYIAAILDGHIIFYLDDKEQMKEPVRFYHSLNSKVGLLKLIPAMDSGVLDYMAEHCDAVILESFGVGGIPTYDSGDFHKSIEDLVRTGKTVVMTTQVTNEGSNMSVYEVGKSIKKEFDLLEAYDMTLEAVVTKLMWILGQTSDPEEIREMFYKTINRDMLFTCAVHD